MVEVPYVLTAAPNASFEAGYERLRRVCWCLGLECDSPSGDGYIRRIAAPHGPIVFVAEATPLNSAAAQLLARDKLGAYQVLVQSGVVVPHGTAVFAREYEGRETGVEPRYTIDEALVRLPEVLPEIRDLEARVLVKPGRESRGRGVSWCSGLDQTLERVRSLFTLGRYALVQRIVDGPEYRVAILNSTPLVAYEKLPPALDGDGRSTVRELIRRFNEVHRKPADDEPLLEPNTLPPIRGVRQWTLDDVPAVGDSLVLSVATYNLSRGGRVQLEPVPSDVIDTALGAHRALGMRYSGVDVRRPSGGGPPVVIEVNGNPVFDELAKSEGDLVDHITAEVVRAIVAADRDLSPARQ
jgi:cyanophycin synthetase